MVFEKLNSYIKKELSGPLFGKKKKEGGVEGEGKEKKSEVVFKIEEIKDRPALPDVEDKTKTDLRYGVVVPYAFIHIYWDEVHGDVVYDVEEPKLDVKEKETLNTLEQGVQELIDISFINIH